MDKKTAESLEKELEQLLKHFDLNLSDVSIEQAIEDTKTVSDKRSIHTEP